MCFHMMCSPPLQMNIAHYETQILIIICTRVGKVDTQQSIGSSELWLY